MACQSRRRLLGFLLLGASLWATAPLGCGARRSLSRDPELVSRFPCQVPPAELARFIEQLPREPLDARFEVRLPSSNLGEVAGRGPVLQLSAQRAIANEELLDGTTVEERIARFHQWAEAFWSGGDTAATARTLYIAAGPEIDVRTLRAFIAVVPKNVELRLLVQNAVHRRAPEDATASDAASLAARLLAETDHGARRDLAKQGYAAFSRCAALDEAVEAADSSEEHERWPELRRKLAAVLPSCACEEVDTGSLRQLIIAEQRAGTVAVGAIPLTFLRDERCGASMPLRSLGKWLGQLERFDAEFAGEYVDEALQFVSVLTNERLLTYFCNALPGETLAALQRARATMYWQVGERGVCEGWQFHPHAPGSPMGTWQRVVNEPSTEEPKALHYWQSAEEIRLFGPARRGESKPTDSGPWPCEQKLRLTGIDERSIHHDGGRWFFEEAACRQAEHETNTGGGCIQSFLSGSPQAEAATPEP